MAHRCFVQINPPPSEGQSQINFFHHDGNEIKLTRPQTTLVKTYEVDGVMHANATDALDFYNAHMKDAIRDSVASSDFLIWSFGTFSQTSFIDLGVVHQIASDILRQSRNADVGQNVERAIVSLSILGFSGDNLDMAVDCLADNDDTKRQALRMREKPNKSGEFFFDNATEVILSTDHEINTVLENGRLSVADARNDYSRLHVLYNFTVRVLCESGDTITQQLSIMDICGADRPKTKAESSKKNNLKLASKRGPGKNKDDRTLKAIHRIIDTLSSRAKTDQSYVPGVRDSKITRLVSTKFHPRSASFKHAFLRLDASASYDESSAIMDYYAKIKDLFRNDKTATARHLPRANRQREADHAREDATLFADRLGMDPRGLKSTDIELNMESPQDLVGLRDALAEMERLQGDDPIEKLDLVSNAYWARYWRDSVCRSL